MSPWVALLWLWLLLTVMTLVSGLVMALVAWGVGAKPEEVRFHSGPTLFAFRALGIWWSFNPLLPGGASVNFAPSGPDGTGEEIPVAMRVPFPRSLLLAASSVIGMALLVLVCLSVTRGLAEVASGFRQVGDVFSARERVTAFFRLLKAQGFWMALGVLSAKGVALNLLPVPPLAGYFLLRELWRGLFTPQRTATPPGVFAAVATTVVFFVLWVGWGVGLFLGLRALAHGPP